MAELYDTHARSVSSAQVKSHDNGGEVPEHTGKRHKHTCKEWEDFQRDICPFPAYTDYLYGRDTRSPDTRNPDNETLDSALTYRSLHSDVLPKYPQRNWMPPEEVAYLQNHARYTPDRPLYNFGPQAHGRLVDTSTPSRGIGSSRRSDSQMAQPFHTRTNSEDEFLRGVDHPQQVQEGAMQPPAQKYSTPRQTPAAASREYTYSKSSESHAQSPLQVKMLRPGELKQDDYGWMPQQERDLTDAKLQKAWAVFHDPGVSENHKMGALVAIQGLSTYVHDANRKTELRRKLTPILWALMKTRQANPPESVPHQNALQTLKLLQSRLTTEEIHYCGVYISRMWEAEQQGQPAYTVLD